MSGDAQRLVTTLHGNRYPLGVELGQGAQGQVFAVEGDNLAIKLLLHCPEQASERLRDQLARVGRLPLEDLRVARPLEQLATPDLGYVMELLTDMAPLSHLMSPPRNTESPVQWYLDSGGLRRRLRLLAHVAEVLAHLHGRGLIYVDPSPNNILVSRDPGAHEVRLIDADNLRPASHTGESLFTPRYGAPEVASGRGPCNSLTDAHAFAVMAFETLTLQHPLMGDLVQQGDPALEQEALAGRLPWVDHTEDDSNRASHGIPRQRVLSEELRQDFYQAFQLGLKEPTARPGMARWAEHLHRAADHTLHCSCGGTSYRERDTCSWCDDQLPAHVVVAAMLWDPRRALHVGDGEVARDPGILCAPGGEQKQVDVVAVGQAETIWLTDRMLNGTTGGTPRVSVELSGKAVKLSATQGDRYHLATPDGEPRRSLDHRPISVFVAQDSHALWLHTGPPEQLHRVLCFDLIPGRGA